MGNPPFEADSGDKNTPALIGNNTAPGAANGNGVGVLGQSVGGDAVFGNTTGGRGVVGISVHGDGVFGNTPEGRGVVGNSGSGVGVLGQSVSNDAVFGNSKDGRGVVGTSQTASGVEGHSVSGVGVVGSSTSGLAGLFNGNVRVTGDILLTGGADCAEQFDTANAEPIEPGTVVVMDPEGALRPSQQAYDKKVAGVISGAGGYRPGIILDGQGPEDSRASVALVGKVYCKVDAAYSPIGAGDLLTTSPTPGHAMKASDQIRAFGSVLGKALRPCRCGRGLIPILIALQ